VTATAQGVLNVARSFIGFTEGRDNDNPFGRWYGQPNVAWCDQFVSYVAAHAGATSIMGRFQYCPSHVKWFKARGRWGRTPRVGAVVFFDWNGDGVADHVGLVEKVLSSVRVQTIEGNTASPGGTAPGARDGVWRKNRSAATILGYGYPEYANPTHEAPAPPPGPGRAVPLVVDGEWGPKTQQRLETFLHVNPADGRRDPAAVRALQRWVGAPADGVWGPVTARALQRKLGVTADGVFGPVSTRALQRFLNRNI
jgi:hypothetical protein